MFGDEPLFQTLEKGECGERSGAGPVRLAAPDPPAGPAGRAGPAALPGPGVPGRPAGPVSAGGHIFSEKSTVLFESACESPWNKQHLVAQDTRRSRSTRRARRSNLNYDLPSKWC